MIYDNVQEASLQATESTPAGAVTGNQFSSQQVANLITGVANGVKTALTVALPNRGQQTFGVQKTPNVQALIDQLPINAYTLVLCGAAGYMWKGQKGIAVGVLLAMGINAMSPPGQRLIKELMA